MTRRLLVAAATAAALLGACELVTKRTGLQCETTADCRSKGAAFAQTICTSEGLCEPVDVPEASVATGCESSQTCTFSLGAPGRCVGGACVSLNPKQPGKDASFCTTFGPVDDDSAILLAGLVPHDGLAGSLAQSIAFAAPSSSGNTGVTLLGGLVTNWNAKAQAHTDAGAPLAPKMAAVVCDESQLDASIKFLHQLNPPIIVGPVTGVALDAVVSGFPKTAVVSPLGDSQTYATPRPNNLLWFCSPNRASMVTPFEKAIDLVSQYAETLPGHGSPPRIALVQNSKEPNEAAFFNEIKSGLTVGGQPIDAQHEQQFDFAEDVTTGTAQQVAQAEQVAQFGPDLVVLTGPVWASPFIYQIENRWSLAPQNTPRPVYLVMRQTDALATLAAGAKPPILNRIVALDVSRDERLQTNYQSLLGAESLLQGGFDEYVGSAFNDCLYAAMYAATAAANAANGTPAPSLLPSQIAAGFAQVAQPQQGYPVDLTQDGITAGLGLLTASAKTQLVGTSIYLGADPQTGVPTLATPTPSMGLSCVGSGGKWESAGVGFGQNGAVMGGSDAGAPAVSCQ